MSTREPTNVAASVKQRLLNLAAKNHEDFNFVLTRYGIERFLYRLSQSNYADDFILKGAMLFHLKPVPLPYRATGDVDLTTHGSPVPTELVHLFKTICQVEVIADGLTFDPKSVQAELIREGQDYEGVRVRLEGRMGSARLPLQIDVGFGDALTPHPKREPLATLLDFPPPCLFINSWETVVAEKFHALVDLGMANSRMKDYFDLHYLATTVPFNGSNLAQAIQATFDRRRTPNPTTLPIGLSAVFSADPMKQSQWQAFHKRIRRDSKHQTLTKTVKDLQDFLMPPVTALTEHHPFIKKWPIGGPWK